MKRLRYTKYLLVIILSISLSFACISTLGNTMVLANAVEITNDLSSNNADLDTSSTSGDAETFADETNQLLRQTTAYSNLRVGYTIQNDYRSPCAMKNKNYPGFVNYAAGVQNTLGAETTCFSYEGMFSLSNDLKSDVLTDGMGYDNIESVDLMFYIGHGYQKGVYYAGCGTPAYNSLHFGTTNYPAVHQKGAGNNPDANFTTYDARYFGYDSRVKWLVAYSCNFLETNDPAVLNMLKRGGRLILGFSSKMVINSDEGTLFAQKCLEGMTLQRAFFNAAGCYQESTLLNGKKYVSCLCFYDDDHPSGTKTDTLTYQDTRISRDKYYCMMYNVNDIDVEL